MPKYASIKMRKNKMNRQAENSDILEPCSIPAPQNRVLDPLKLNLECKLAFNHPCTWL